MSDRERLKEDIRRIARDLGMCVNFDEKHDQLNVFYRENSPSVNSEFVNRVAEAAERREVYVCLHGDLGVVARPSEQPAREYGGAYKKLL